MTPMARSVKRTGRVGSRMWMDRPCDLRGGTMRPWGRWGNPSSATALTGGRPMTRGGDHYCRHGCIRCIAGHVGSPDTVIVQHRGSGNTATTSTTSIVPVPAVAAMVSVLFAPTAVRRCRPRPLPCTVREDLARCRPARDATTGSLTCQLPVDAETFEGESGWLMEISPLEGASTCRWWTKGGLVAQGREEPRGVVPVSVDVPGEAHDDAGTAAYVELSAANLERISYRRRAGSASSTRRSQVRPDGARRRFPGSRCRDRLPRAVRTAVVATLAVLPTWSSVRRSAQPLWPHCAPVDRRRRPQPWVTASALLPAGSRTNTA